MSNGTLYEEAVVGSPFTIPSILGDVNKYGHVSSIDLNAHSLL